MLRTKHIQALLVSSVLVGVLFIVATPGNAAPNKPTPPPSCYKPQSVTTQISGYTEGSTNKLSGIITGKETTYNLVTFQREDFSFKEQMSTAGRVLGNYVGTVQGFVTNQAAPTDFTTFNNQYASQFAFSSEAANATIWSGFASLPGRQGTVHFATSSAATPQPIAPVNGDQAYLVLSNPPLSVGESGQAGYFFLNGKNKSYIVNCLVDIPTLMNDINSGNGSVVKFNSALVAPWRSAAASAAQSAAQDYNNRVQTKTG